MFIPLFVSCLSTPLWGIIDKKFPKRKMYFMISLSIGLSLALQLDVTKDGILNWPL